MVAGSLTGVYLLLSKILSSTKAVEGELLDGKRQTHDGRAWECHSPWNSFYTPVPKILRNTHLDPKKGQTDDGANP